MNNDFGFELRDSWRQLEVPTPEDALQAFERSRPATPEATPSVVDQAVGILMGRHGSDGDTMRQLLVRTADSNGVDVTALAQAVIDLVAGTSPSVKGDPAVEAAMAALVPSRVEVPADSASSAVARARQAIDLRDAARQPPLAGTA